MKSGIGLRAHAATTAMVAEAGSDSSATCVGNGQRSVSTPERMSSVPTPMRGGTVGAASSGQRSASTPERMCLLPTPMRVGRLCETLLPKRSILETIAYHDAALKERTCCKPIADCEDMLTEHAGGACGCGVVGLPL